MSANKDKKIRGGSLNEPKSYIKSQAPNTSSPCDFREHFFASSLLCSTPVISLASFAKSISPPSRLSALYRPFGPPASVYPPRFSVKELLERFIMAYVSSSWPHPPWQMRPASIVLRRRKKRVGKMVRRCPFAD